MKTTNIARRTFLRGLGACLPLPWLEAMGAPAAIEAQSPVRLVWLYTKSGMWMPEFTPKETGTDWNTTPILEPLSDLRSEINVLTGLRHANAFRPNPVVGRHDQEEMCHLTGADLGRVPGIAAKNSISVDQVAARALGKHTRIPVLNVSITQQAIVFNGNGDRVPSEHRPEVVFDRLFGDRTAESIQQMERRFRRKKSILDELLAQTNQLNRKLGAADRDKIEAYLASVRDVELRLQNERRWAGVEPPSPPEGSERPRQRKERYHQVRAMLDLIVLALQTDQTRLATFKLGDMGCSYPEVGSPDGYHSYTHASHVEGPGRRSMVKVDRVRIDHFAYFLRKLREIPDGQHDLLYNSFIHYGSGMSTTHGEGDIGLGKKGDDLPNLTAGRAGGRIKSGRHIDYGRAPLSNLYTSMLETAGVEKPVFGDATGSLDEIS